MPARLSRRFCPDGHMWFTERNADAVGSIPLTATSGSEITEYPVGHANAGVIGIVAGPDNRMWFGETNEDRLAAVTTGVGPPPDGEVPTSGGGSATGGGGPPAVASFQPCRANRPPSAACRAS